MIHKYMKIQKNTNETRFAWRNDFDIRFSLKFQKSTTTT